MKIEITDNNNNSCNNNNDNNNSCNNNNKNNLLFKLKWIIKLKKITIWKEEKTVLKEI